MNKSELNLSNLPSDQPVLDLQKSLITHDLWGKKLLIGVSGGVDSMALLTALKDLNQHVLVVHINYGLRGTDSDLDQQLVEQISQFYGFEMASFSVSYSKEVGNLQAWARNIRYEYFEALRVEEDCDAIVLAHHRDDQVETLIQKIFRASSPHNWMGMKAWDEQRHLLRPWLSIPKAEIVAYATSKAVPFREDASNNQTKYNRNWIRNRWKPDLDQHFPGWEANILGMQEYAKLLGQYRDHWLAESVSTREKEDHEGISIAKLATCPEMMRQDLLKAFIEAHSLYDAHAHLSAGILVEAVKLMQAETGSMVPISDRLLIYKDRDQLRLSPSDAFGKPLSGDSPVEFDKASLPMKQLGFSFALQSHEQVDVPLAERNELYLDVHDVQWPLRLRNWKPGDRFNPIGMKGHVKISDFLVNRKVPRHIKSGYLVLEDGNKKIIAVLYPPQNNNESNHVGIPSDDHKCSIDTFEVMMVTRMEST